MTSGTVQKATELLFFLNSQSHARGVSEIATAIAAPKTSVHRLLQSLRHRNLVEQDERGRYQLGIGLVALGLGASGREPLLRAARPIMSEAAARLGETFFLVSARAGELVVLDKVEGSGFLRVSPQVGSTVPADCTAVGRLYLALAPEQLNAVLGPENELADLERVKKDGIAHSHGEWQDSLSAVAAPVRVEGRLLGAVVAGLITSRLEEVGVDKVSSSVLAARDQIERELEGKLEN